MSQPQVTTQKAIANFKEAFKNGTHPGYSTEDYALYEPEARKETSILKAHGVRLIAKNPNNKWLFVCLTQNCLCKLSLDKRHIIGSPIKIYPKSTHHATIHLSDSHGIVSEKTKSSSQKASAQKRIANDSADAFKKDPTCYLSNILAHWTARHGIPFRAFQDNAWNLFQAALDPAIVPEDALKNFDPRKSLPS